MTKNLSMYTEFQNIEIGQKFIDADGHEYTKCSDNEGRHEDVRYVYGFMDYAFAADDHLRVQAQPTTGAEG